MKSLRRLLLASFLLILLANMNQRFGTVASAKVQNDDNTLLDVQSASGTITSIRDDEFTIDVQTPKPPEREFAQQDHTRMTFVINSKTKIDGTLEVGASADVRYRRQNENNIAVTVRVTAIS
jgi:hypothetical protein